MDHLVFGVKNSQEKEGFTSCQSPKGEDRKEPQFDILLSRQGGAKSLTNKRSQRKYIIGKHVTKIITHLEDLSSLRIFAVKK